MNKTVKVAIIIVIVIVIILGIYVVNSLINKQNKSNLEPMESGEDLVGLVDKIYEEIPESELLMLESQILDITNNDSVKYITGLENGTNFEYVVVSEPLMSSQAYSLVLAKVKSGINADEIAKQMSENIDTRKWICVEAEKVYVTNYKDVIFLVMASDEWATPVYNEFKNLVGGKVGEELVKTTEI